MQWKTKAEGDLRKMVTAKYAGRVVVSVQFVEQPPASYSKARRRVLLEAGWPRGDLDNRVKSICDALTAAGAWDDDDQVVDIRASKRYGDSDETVVRVSAFSG
jgi:Holliday junction resolvase RusA-like endonuclease